MAGWRVTIIDGAGVVITGGGAGIGRATALAMAEVGADVAAADGYAVLPLAVNVSGKYAHVTDFLHRMRALVKLRKGGVEANGKLFVAQPVTQRRRVTAHLYPGNLSRLCRAVRLTMPLLEQAVVKLQGTGSSDEAYADYNLA